MTFDALQSLLPQILLALGATAVLLLGAWFPARRLWLRCGVVIAVLAALSAVTLDPVLHEVGAMFSTSLYARSCTAIWSVLIAAALLISQRYSETHDFAGAEYSSLMLFAGCGMSLLSAATSFVGLFLGLEAFTLVLYILIAFNRNDGRGAEAGLKYLVFGAVATGFLAFGIALLYAATGTFVMADSLAALQTGNGLRPLGLAGWAMLLVAVGFKTSLAPFHLWTPDVYQGAPAPVTAVLATAAKGAVLTALLPLLTMLGGAAGQIKEILWLLAIVTMLAGTFAALVQTNLKRMLAYSSVVHMGYLLMALLVSNSAGQNALLFYLVVYSLSTFGAFAVLTSMTGSGAEIQEYTELRGLGFRYPRRSLALAAFLFSLAGIPPLAGFFAKFTLFRAALAHGYGELTVIGIFASLLSVGYYLRPVVVLFMENEAGGLAPRQGAAGEYAVVACCLVAVLFFGLFPAPLIDLVSLIAG